MQMNTGTCREAPATASAHKERWVPGLCIVAVAGTALSVGTYENQLYNQEHLVSFLTIVTTATMAFEVNYGSGLKKSLLLSAVSAVAWTSWLAIVAATEISMSARGIGGVGREAWLVTGCLVAASFPGLIDSIVRTRKIRLRNIATHIITYSTALWTWTLALRVSLIYPIEARTTRVILILSSLGLAYYAKRISLGNLVSSHRDTRSPLGHITEKHDAVLKKG